MRFAEINVMKRAAERAAHQLIRDFGELENLQVPKRGYGNFIATANAKSEEKIKSELSRARPELSFLSEESETSGSYWIVDAIGGIANFARGIPQFTINIALVKNGEVTAGLTLDPMRSDCFTATLGGGAFISNRNRLRVSGCEDIDGTITALHAPAHADSAIADKGATLRRTGSAALDLAYLAAGKFDAVVALDVHIRETASGTLMAREAGGFLELDKLDNGKCNIIAASSLRLLGKLSAVLEKILDD